MAGVRARGARGASALAAATLSLAQSAFAGGSPENALLIIDPSRIDSMHVGNYYRKARDIPDSNVLYMNPGAPDYVAFTQRNIPALLGRLQSSGIADHIDYIIIANPDQFYVNAPNLVSDGCFQVTRFSLTGAYATLPISNTILAGTVSTLPNQYYSGTESAIAFNAQTGWSAGQPYGSVASKYYIGAMLGYSGSLGNTVAETLAMIDRSVAADGTRPAGTVYFMQTPDLVRSGPRQNLMVIVANAMNARGGPFAAQVLQGLWLPTGHFDCLGVMTGFASAGLTNYNFSLVPGAFCDHLTSWAATFDNFFQEKVSRWIVKGASGSWGTVEEPCAYLGKFPHPRVHSFYTQGLSLGEAVMRGIGYAPFQGLLYGDPLTRTFSYLPGVSISGLPVGKVDGSFTLTPSATAAAPGASINGLDLLLNGVLTSSIRPGETFEIDTTRLPDGCNDIRVLAYDSTPQRNVGRWTGRIMVSNYHAPPTIVVDPPTGDLATGFTFTVFPNTSEQVEVRLKQQGRPVAASVARDTATFTVFGSTFGPGPVDVSAEVLFNDGRTARSLPVSLNIASAGIPQQPQPPIAFSYSRSLRTWGPDVIDLPATTNGDPSALQFEVLTQPQMATIVGDPTAPQRVLRPTLNASGSDSITFRVSGPGGTSNTATLYLQYDYCLGDVDGNHAIELLDLATMLQNFGASGGASRDQGDVNGDGTVNLSDLSVLISNYMLPCQ